MSETQNPELKLIPVDFDPFVDQAVRALPITSAQAEMWAAMQLGPEASCSYNQCFVLTLRGLVSAKSMQRALQTVVDRHESLRTTFDADGHTQRVADKMSVSMQFLDVSAQTPESRTVEINRIVTAETHLPFNVEQGPLFRARLVQEATDAYRLIFTASHLVCDGWSSSVLFADLARVYAADRVGINAPLPPVRSYSQYVLDEVATDVSVASGEDKDYWLQQHEGATLELDLPLDRRRPPLRTFTGAREVRNLDEVACKKIKRAGARHGCTLFVTLLAAFEVLLFRLSGQSDFVLGIPIAGQPLLENGHLVAHCVNTLPLRCIPNPTSTFAEHLTSVREAFLDAQSHARVTFGSLLPGLRRRNDPSRPPIVAATFNIDKLTPKFDFGDVSVEKIEAPRSFVNFEIAINIVDSGTDLIVECDYNADLFDRQSIKRWLGHYQVLLDSIERCNDVHLASMPLFTSGERDALLARPFNANDNPAKTLLHARFEDLAGRNGDRIAVTCEGRSLSYAELNACANRIAHRLRALGLKPDELVCVSAERGLALLLGILAVLKAGGAYLPLEPALPQERAAFMLKDAGVRLVVTETSLADRFREPRLSCLLLDTLLEAPEHNPEPIAGPDNLAYAIYTSGSTGEPKGVLITHANVTSLFESTSSLFEFGSDDVWALFHSCAFDFSVWEIWGALLYGGRVVIVPYWVSRDPAAFRRLLLAERVSVVNQTPFALRQLIQADLAERRGDYALRYVFSGGESLELHSLRPWFERYGDRRPQLINVYGITETTVLSTSRQIRWADVEGGQSSVIGMPFPDVYIRLLDAQGEPVPVGVPGEIYVGGAGVARGYLNRPELTAQRFMTDPFDAVGEARLYRSGDLARKLANGDIEFLGRVDQQVKIRGFRIELGEVEAAIARSPRVADVAVVVREDTPNDKRLVAYVVATGPAAGLIDELRQALAGQLPAYMVPAHIVLIDAIPINANGKVDRKALTAVDIPRIHDAAIVPPRNDIEQLIFRIMSDSLSRNDFGVFQNFFDLGGHSLVAARMMARLRSETALDLPLRILFEHPTVASLSDAVEALRWSATDGMRGVPSTMVIDL